MIVEADELVSVAEIADAAGVSRSLVSRWMTRRIDFPTPVAHLALGPLFLWPQVAAWLAETGRDEKPNGEAVRRRYGRYDRYGEELALVDELVYQGARIGEACKIVASHTRPPSHTQLTNRLRRLYPGWKARERTRGMG